ncbi:hypothetical protein ACFWIX_12355 [Pseudarthrobacter sp. NPDC058362]|uniref:hypothetical protein n=1 Tax=unclassified Pseudarthrobacter TaxID=2647000 RepID=UPI003665504F
MNFQPAALPLAALLLLTGCGAVGDAAGSAASEAGSKVASAAADEVTRQVCAVIKDGLVSTSDKQVLGGLVDAAATAGLPAEITTPMRQIAESGDQVPSDSVNSLREACGA